MISKSAINEVIARQLATTNRPTYKRKILDEINFNIKNFAYIVSGIRRCGKSTLVQQILSQQPEKSLYINFDTPSLFGFQMNDFRTLDSIIEEKKTEWLFFDEIQVVEGWEIYIRSKLEQDFHVVVTGSNSSMLSRELGTRLTGRHISHTLYPFSYNEFIGYTKQKSGADTMLQYLESGGFPEYINSKAPRIITELINDILYRDILVRYNLRDDKAIKNLFVYLMGNIGNLTSANKLTYMIGVKSASTISDYLSYLENSYLISLLSKFTYSYKKQLINPKKIYSIDLGLHSLSTPSFSQDTGRKLENEVYLELKRKELELFYFNENHHECDFILCKQNKPIDAVQVCEKITAENEEREVAGLLEALDYLNLEKGTIITLDQDDIIFQKKKEIRIIPVWKWLDD